MLRSLQGWSYVDTVNVRSTTNFPAMWCCWLGRGRQVDKGFVAQVADVIGGREAPMNAEQRQEGKKTIPGEFSQVKHVRGILSMGRWALSHSFAFSFYDSQTPNISWSVYSIHFPFNHRQPCWSAGSCIIKVLCSHGSSRKLRNNNWATICLCMLSVIFTSVLLYLALASILKSPCGVPNP